MRETDLHCIQVLCYFQTVRSFCSFRLCDFIFKYENIGNRKLQKKNRVLCVLSVYFDTDFTYCERVS